MRAMVTGAAGMVGRKLVESLCRDPMIGGGQLTALTLVDVLSPPIPSDAPAEIDVSTAVGTIDERALIDRLVGERPDVIFHLAAIVSGEAELDFEKGYRVNLVGSQNLLEAIRCQTDYCPRVVTASSIAVYGTPFDDPIADDFQLTPLTSYGTQKAIGELLLADYSRRGFLDGVGLRLPTIVVRPGVANGAASSFFSGIIREPLAGQPAILPVSKSVMHWLASPRSAVGFFRHAAEIDTAALGARRSLVMPGLAVSVGDMLESLQRTAGDDVRNLVTHEPDEMITTIVAGWPRIFEAKRAAELGFVAETTFDEIIKVYIEDEMGGQLS